MIKWFAHCTSLAVLALVMLSGEARALADGVRSSAAPTPAPTPAEVTVVLEGADHARLEQMTADGRWQTMCYAPCGSRLATAGEVRIAGEGLKSSQPFRLSARNRDRVVLQVSAATSEGTAAGVVLVSVGPALMAAGVMLAVLSLSTTLGDAPAGDARYDGARTEGRIGGALLVVGLVATAIGVPVGILTLVANSRTRVRDEGERPALPARVPDVDRAGRERHVDGPRATSVPLFVAAF